MSTFKIHSDAFEHQAAIPVRFTFQGKSISPRITFEDVPRGTQEIALICEDYDVPMPKSFVHWMIYGIEPTQNELPENLPKTRSLEHPISARQGENSFMFAGYLGPNPGFWDSAHRYHFRAFALRKPSGLPPGAGRKEFFEAIEGKVIDETDIVGTYAKTLPQRIKAVAFWGSLIGGIAGLALAARKKSTWVEQIGRLRSA